MQCGNYSIDLPELQEDENYRFHFDVSCIGMFLLAFVLLLEGQIGAASPLIALALLVALAQAFFTYEDKRTLSENIEYEAELTKTLRIYNEFFKFHQAIRFGTFFLGALLLPLLVLVMLKSPFAILVLGFALFLMCISEFIDRFLFYKTVVPLNIAGGFFVGTQRVVNS